MDIILLVIGFLFILLGILGSFLPVIPGPLTGWIGLLLVYLTAAVPTNVRFLTITFFVALGIFLLDNIIPIIGTKKFGGTRSGVIGSTIGLIVGILFLGPFGLILGPFLGAFIGEYITDSNDLAKALKAAVGSLIGFITGVFLKFVTGIIFLYYFIKIVWQYKFSF